MLFLFLQNLRELHEVDVGLSARVFRFTEGGIQKVLRKAELESEDDRRRFLEASSTLEILARGEHRGEPGSQYLFDLESVGFSEESQMTAVQVYRWIEGHDLEEKLGMLPEDGSRIARSL